MESDEKDARRFRVAEFILDRSTGSLTGPDSEIRLRPQTFRLLEVLVVNAPRILSSDELIDRSWGVDYVSVGAIRQTISELRQALGDSATTPRIVETVHRRGYRLIADIEELPEHDPSPATPANAAVVDSTDDETSARASAREPIPPPSAGPVIGRRRLAWLGLSLLLMLALGLSQLPNKTSGPESDTVHIAEITNLSEDPRRQGTTAAIAEMLRSRLAIRGGLQVINVPSDTAASQLPVHTVIHGSLATTGDGQDQILYVDLRVEDGSSGGTLDTPYESGTEEELSAMVDRLVLSILGTLGRLPPDRDRRVVNHKMFASSAYSLRLFSEALEALGDSQVATARAKLEEAVEVDPDNATLWENLAAVYAHQGMASLAEETAVQAARLAEGTAWEPARSAAARAAEMLGDWPRAVELLKTLSQRFPQERQYGLRLADAFIRLGRLEEAQNEVDRLRQVTGEHTALDLLEITILMRVNRLDEAEALARQVAENAPGGPLGAPGTGQKRLLRIHLRQGRLAEAHALIESLSSSFSRLELRQRASMLCDHAGLSQKTGKLDGTLGLYQRAETIFQQLGDRTGLVGLLNLKAHFLLRIGELEGADAALREARELTDEPGLEDKRLVTLCLLAQVAAAMDRLEEADAFLAAARALEPAPQDPRRYALWLRTAADVYLARDQPQQAAEYYAECVAFSADIGDTAAASHARIGLARIARQRDQLDAAKTHVQEAIEGFIDLGSVPDQLVARCELAELALTNDDSRAAEEAFRKVFSEASELSLAALGARAQAGLEAALALSTESNSDPGA